MNQPVNSRTELMARRYALVPQMRDYDRLLPVAAPYRMFTQPPDFVSPACTTDARGFRLTPRGAERIDYERFRTFPGTRCVTVGGSTVFGVGAGSDAATIAGQMNHLHPEECWFNAGGRAYNSTQEFIQYYQYFAHLRPARVALLSGVNNLELFCCASAYDMVTGAFYGERQYLAQADAALRPVKRHSWRARLAALWREPPAPAPAVREKDEHDLYAGMERDLAAMAALCRAYGTKVHYFLQPVATWIDRPLAPEEAQLFELLDRMPGNPYAVYAGEIRARRDSFRARVQAMTADLGIPFTDLNDCLRGATWYFVDRVHLTDAGYRAVATAMARALQEEDR